MGRSQISHKRNNILFQKVWEGPGKQCSLYMGSKHSLTCVALSGGNLREKPSGGQFTALLGMFYLRLRLLQSLTAVITMHYSTLEAILLNVANLKKTIISEADHCRILDNRCFKIVLLVFIKITSTPTNMDFFLNAAHGRH